MSTTAVKERPIIFSAPMVRAILDGRKTQTRRIVKPQPEPKEHEPGKHWWRSAAAQMMVDVEGFLIGDDETVPGCFCPYGNIGDRLWVRETVCILDRDHWWDSTEPKDHLYSLNTPRRNGCAYRSETDSDGESIRKGYGYKWTPAIHMPRWASRLTLELTEVRVQRVQDIGHDGRRAAGVMAEGITPEQIAIEQKWFHPDDAPAIAFSRLWESVNGKGSWSRNDWVWAITFRRVEATNV
jgi:hypothetical protein